MESSPETAVAHLLKLAEKFRRLKALVADGMADIEAGRIAEWNLRGFLRGAREKSPD
jgi:hypothetical protein